MCSAMKATGSSSKLLALLHLLASSAVIARGQNEANSPAALSPIGTTTTTAETPAWALPVPYWIFGYLLGPIICMAIALAASLALTAWRPLANRPEAAVFLGLLPSKQKKWQISVTKAIVFMAMVASFATMTSRVFSNWQSGPSWLVTSYWLVYYRINGALITSVFTYELLFAADFEWDNWLHHSSTIIMFCISLTQTFIPASDRPYVISWVIIYGWVSALDFPVYFCMSYYHIATSDAAALKRKYWATLIMCATKCLTIPAMNILPLTYTLYNWSNLSWAGTKAILLSIQLPFLLVQILGAITFYKIMKLNQRRYRCSIAKPAGQDSVSLEEGQDKLAMSSMDGTINGSFNERYAHEDYERTTTGRSTGGGTSGMQRQSSAPRVKLSIATQPPADQANPPTLGDVEELSVAARQALRLRKCASMQPSRGQSSLKRQATMVQTVNRIKSDRYQPQLESIESPRAAAAAPTAVRALKTILASFKNAVRDHVDRSVDDEGQATDEDVVKLLNTEVVRMLLGTCVRVALSSTTATAHELAEIEQLAVLSGMSM